MESGGVWRKIHLNPSLARLLEPWAKNNDMSLSAAIDSLVWDAWAASEEDFKPKPKRKRRKAGDVNQ